MLALKMRVPAFFTGFLLTIFTLSLLFSLDWRHQSRFFPLVISIPTVTMLIIQLGVDLLKPRKAGESLGAVMDLPVDTNVPTNKVLTRAGIMLGWLAGLVMSIWLLGFVVSIPLFVCLYLSIQAREKWSIVLIGTAAIITLEVGLFHKVLHVYWAQPVFPFLKDAVFSVIGA